MSTISESFYYDSKRSIGEVLFFNQFFGVIVEAGNETCEKIWNEIGAEQKCRAEQKRVVFVHTAVFERARN